MEIKDLKKNLGKLVYLDSRRLRHTGEYMLSAIILRKDNTGGYKYQVELHDLKANCIITVGINSIYALPETKNQPYQSDTRPKNIREIQNNTLKKLQEIAANKPNLPSNKSSEG